jgi:hypothetical protein
MNDIQHSENSEFPGLELVALKFNVCFPDLAGGKSDMEGSALRINALDRRIWRRFDIGCILVLDLLELFCAYGWRRWTLSFVP